MRTNCWNLPWFRSCSCMWFSCFFTTSTNCYR